MSHLTTLPPPHVTLFPYTTLFRSADQQLQRRQLQVVIVALGEQLPDQPSEMSRERRCVIHAGESSSRDRKSTRLNSSQMSISYAVFCLKKKTHITNQTGITRHLIR